MDANSANMLSMLQGTKVYSVPIYQRRYSWVIEEWRMLWDDIQIKATELSQNGTVRPHFLGNIVVQEAEDNESTVRKYLVIDGQQRLITIITLLAAIRDAKQKNDPKWDPASYNNKYLQNPYDDHDPDRLVPTEFDRLHYLNTITKSSPSGSIGRCYAYFARQLHNLSSADLDTISTVTLRHLQIILVETDANDPVNTIFNTLNSRGRPLLPPDLIRNEIFSHLDEERSKRLYRDTWIPIEDELVSTSSTGTINSTRFVTLFWSRELPEAPRLAKKSLYSAFEKRLREKLEGLNREARSQVAIEELKAVAEDFTVYKAAVNPVEYTGYPWPNNSLRTSVARLQSWGSDTHIPITLWVLKHVKSDKLDPSTAFQILDYVLRYIIARAIVGIPSNSLNRVLSSIPARLQSEIGEQPLNAMTKELDKSNNRWPGHESVAAGYREAQFSGLRDEQIGLITQLLSENGYEETPENIADLFSSPEGSDEIESDIHIRIEDSIFDVLQELTPYQYTTCDDLATVLRIDEEAARAGVLAQDDSIVSLVRTDQDQVPSWVPAARRRTGVEEGSDPTKREHMNAKKLRSLLAHVSDDYTDQGE